MPITFSRIGLAPVIFFGFRNTASSLGQAPQPAGIFLKLLPKPLQVCVQAVVADLGQDLLDVVVHGLVPFSHALQ